MLLAFLLKNILLLIHLMFLITFKNNYIYL
nr:MAG TPA: hypothetical protein [Caudoviricetes sp.]DAO68057.1 MAG TPA: hypothetical protein [Caudoviricetes sp.]DAS65748.1 MAG TPA: hypothetical protein [Caudoviricetes sp.]DAV93481.1 MAG TPA: hypothetical protein [Caudoviricetes sp.]